MKIIERLAKKADNSVDNEGVTIAFLGDSVTQGWFELYRKTPESLGGVCDKNNVYHSHLAKILALMYPEVPVNIINAGLGGDRAPHGSSRLQRDVLRHEPDLVVVCFGLNDFVEGEKGLSDYTNALENIFTEVQKSGSELIFMTPNMCNTTINAYTMDDLMLETAQVIMERQAKGYLDMYMEAAIATCRKYGVVVCDCYRKWKLLSKANVDITELLANKINHPIREMHWMFAYSLFETMLEN